MEYQISQGGKVVGTFDFGQVVDGIRDGTFANEDHYWCKGMSQWETIAHFRRTKISTQTPVVATHFKPYQRAASAGVKAPVAGADSQYLIGMAGGAMVVLSAVTPFLRVAIVSATLMQISDVRAWILIGLGAFCFLASLGKEMAALRILAAGALVAGLEIAVLFWGRLSELDAAEARQQHTNEFGEAMSRAIRASIGPDIGSVLLGLGVVCLLYAAFIAPDKA